jgi:hypothetical protein
MVDFISIKRGERRKNPASSATLIMIMFESQELGLSPFKGANNHGKSTMTPVLRDNSRSHLE